MFDIKILLGLGGLAVGGYLLTRAVSAKSTGEEASGGGGLLTTVSYPVMTTYGATEGATKKDNVTYSTTYNINLEAPTGGSGFNIPTSTTEDTSPTTEDTSPVRSSGGGGSGTGMTITPIEHGHLTATTASVPVSVPSKKDIYKTWYSAPMIGNIPIGQVTAPSPAFNATSIFGAIGGW